MFGRKSATDSGESPESTSVDGKGRPTPSRKEAEAARLARVRPARTRKERSARDRAARSEVMSKRREALKTGDERNLPARDRGPVRRFVRDFIDSRFLVAEILLPVLILSMILNFTNNIALRGLATTLMFTMLLMTALNFVVIILKLRKQLGLRFPEDPAKGTTWYALSRSLQMRFLRLPKPQVRIGEQLPEIYR